MCILTVKAPSKIKAMVVVFNKFLPFPGYFAITLFGKILIRETNKSSWERQIKTGDANITLNHETIHLRQAQSTCDSWWVYYIKYIYEYIKNQPWKNGTSFAYYMIPFEMEAYKNELNLSYLHGGKSTTGWKKYSNMSVSERLNIWNDYKTSKVIGFGRYLRERDI